MAEHRNDQTAEYHEFWGRVAGTIITQSTQGLTRATLWNAVADWSIDLASALASLTLVAAQAICMAGKWPMRSPSSGQTTCSGRA